MKTDLRRVPNSMALLGLGSAMMAVVVYTKFVPGRNKYVREKLAQFNYMAPLGGIGLGLIFVIGLTFVNAPVCMR